MQLRVPLASYMPQPLPLLAVHARADFTDGGAASATTNAETATATMIKSVLEVIIYFPPY